MKSSKQKTTTNRYLILTLALLVGFSCGLLARTQAEPMLLASAEQKESAKQTISALYLSGQPTESSCVDAADPALQQELAETVYKYLQVNGYANRAVLRICDGSDRLIAKTSNGSWIMTDVNLNLDARANPAWQKECLIQDITIEDTEMRPENASIDSSNLAICKKIKKM